jgi:RNA polymerase sigma factor (sigma-70 family)
MYLNTVTLTSFPGENAEARTTREATVLQYIDLVHILAKRLQFRLPPCITFDDLVGAGTIGLIQAVDRFQPSRGLTFGTYARHRIWGAMLDFLRAEDPLSRTERRRIRTAEATQGISKELADIALGLPSSAELADTIAQEPDVRGMIGSLQDRLKAKGIDSAEASQLLSLR